MAGDASARQQRPTAARAAVALTVAGSDPSGGAGIQADLKTFCRLGVYGAAAITCLTVQNTRGVQAVHCLDAGLVVDQVAAVLDDLPVTHIKTGMLGTAAIARQLGRLLARFTGEVVVDPVLVSSSGHPLFEADSLAVFQDDFLPAATVITPNRPELELLAGHACPDRETVVAACRTLFLRYPRLRTICVTGGHFHAGEGQVIDYLVRRSATADAPLVTSREHPRIEKRIGHGTGCTFAAGFAAYHLLTDDDEAAFTGAVDFVADLLATSPVMGHGTAPLAHHRPAGREQ